MSENELLNILGADKVIEDSGILSEYSRDQSFVLPVRPRCVVKPESMEEVQAVVKWANDTLTPLVPASSGPPRFRGDTVPSVGGAVIVDLSRMKKIMRIDRRNRVCLIEAGVTYGELIPELEKNDMAPHMPLLPRSTKSVVAACLEREPITAPFYHWSGQESFSTELVELDDEAEVHPSGRPPAYIFNPLELEEAFKKTGKVIIEVTNVREDGSIEGSAPFGSFIVLRSGLHFVWKKK